VALSLWPARRHRTSDRLSSSSLAGSSGRSSGSSWGWFVIRQNGGVVVVIFREQGSYFAQLLGCLLQHFNLLAQLRVLGLLAAQDLVNVLHASPYVRI